MRHAFGLEIPETLQELVEHRAALLVWDMQHAVVAHVTNRAQVVAGVQRVLAAARGAGVPVMYSQHYSLPFEAEDVAWIRTWWRRTGGESPESLVPIALPNTHQWELVPEVAAQSQDVILPKTRPSLFIGTPAREVLASRGVRTLVITGVTTDQGVLTTARHAAMIGLMPVVVSDAVGSRTDAAQERGLRACAEVADMTTSRELMSCWLAGGDSSTSR